MSVASEQALGAMNTGGADPQETREWPEAPQDIIGTEGPQRATFLLDRQIEYAHINGVTSPLHTETPYINAVPVENQDHVPGNRETRHRIRSYTYWNAMTMVLCANKDTNVGDCISSFASAATLYGAGCNHPWRAPSDKHNSDMVLMQGHPMPGAYSCISPLDRLTEGQFDNFRQEVDSKGISSYPHPWLVPGFWQFPTASMDLGPIMAIYQARFTKYLASRGLIQNWGSRRVWVFSGDGETNESESLGAIGVASREKLDNLVFVISYNPQCLDGSVRSNGKITQELESKFRGADWNAVKIIWDSRWDRLPACDTRGLLMNRMMGCVDSGYQTFRPKDGAYVREHFFSTPELEATAANWSDDGVWALSRNDHDPYRIYAAFQPTANHRGYLLYTPPSPRDS